MPLLGPHAFESALPKSKSRDPNPTKNATLSLWIHFLQRPLTEEVCQSLPISRYSLVES
jgi:hypothetical protein